MIGVLQGDSASPEVESYLMRTSADVRRSLPITEKIEISRGVIETSNGWLHSELDKFERDSFGNMRILILSAISERLAGIISHAEELERAGRSARSKDDDKQKLNEILSREEYQKPAASDESLFQRWLREFLEWLAGLFPRPNISPSASAGLQPLALVLQVFIYGLIIALVGFLIYRFAPGVAARFSRREKETQSGRVILGERIEASASALDLFSEAESLARRGELRAAIRKGYIALLCDLADRKIIGLARHKTNRDYLREVRKRSSTFARMKNATGSFERHWYGFRDPRPDEWDEFIEQCRSALNGS
jgi:hypothetical protein